MDYTSLVIRGHIGTGMLLLEEQPSHLKSVVGYYYSKGKRYSTVVLMKNSVTQNIGSPFKYL